MKKPPYSYTLTLRMLRYIAKSPPRGYGGFGFPTIETAKSALHYLRHGKPVRRG